ncbi:glycosyltransferase family 2 protein [Sulfuriroseicoccus oceanibius]|uniref:Glycosyltransferase family 2 protein n=1 Tax=Sulfuriroseicoccus oceanibius TaxID=2707525 RepID=A0A6B3L9S4_9BACT|nr:glycosyltransferase family 2 protein [Sulfuriroseicoccus oceanibius]QQL45718.1 glycosyltransferase family 2 protein [Sulfuriroseicoccus oceanibius]
MTTEIFVGVPAYNTGEKLLRTLQSLLDQSFQAYRVLITVEPTDHSARTLEIANHFAALDARFEVSMNDEVLGWAGNVRHAMKCARSSGVPFFMVLPHDDALHPDCLASLHATLITQPDAVIAFPDIYFFGAADGLQSCPSRQSTTARRLLDHFSDGGNPEFWKGLTRNSSLPPDTFFPAYGKKSFAAEYEWAASLLSHGHSVREPRAIYYKRIHPADGDSVSTGWIHRDSLETQRRSLDTHRERMLALIERLPETTATTTTEAEAILAAFEISHLWRVQEMTQERTPFTYAEHQRIAHLRNELPQDSPAQLRLDLCELRNRLHDTPPETLVDHARLLADSLTNDHDAQTLYMKLLLRCGHHHTAVHQMTRLAQRFPNSWRNREVSQWLGNNLFHHHQIPAPTQSS